MTRPLLDLEKFLQPWKMKPPIAAAVQVRSMVLGWIEFAVLAGAWNYCILVHFGGRIRNPRYLPSAERLGFGPPYPIGKGQNVAGAYVILGVILIAFATLIRRAYFLGMGDVHLSKIHRTHRPALTSFVVGAMVVLSAWVFWGGHARLLDAL